MDDEGFGGDTGNAHRYCAGVFEYGVRILAWGLVLGLVCMGVFWVGSEQGVEESEVSRYHGLDGAVEEKKEERRKRAFGRGRFDATDLEMRDTCTAL